MLKDQEMNVNQILGHLTIGQATLSSHLSKLKKCGLVVCRVMGKERIYKLNEDVVDVLLADIEKLRSCEIIVRRKMTQTD
jgi:DNA-binding transcriptional ArsR family regulator